MSLPDSQSESDEHQQLFRIFEMVTALPAAERISWIDSQQLSADVQQQLLAMLEADDGFDDEESAAESPGRTAGIPADPIGISQFPEIPNYQIERVIDRGGAGVVYQARQLNPSRHVAIKMLRMGLFSSDSNRRRFLREASAASGIDHPAIVPVYETGEFRGEPFISMKLIDGTTLEQLLRNQQISRDEAILALLNISHGIAVAHQQGIIHRDLKPSNILIDRRNGAAWITDFGLARDLTEEIGLTATGDTLGTPGYMAPEQLGDAASAVTTATDVYGLGATLYRILTGSPPLSSSEDNPALFISLIRQHDVEAPAERTAGIPPALNDICMRALETRPDDRYASAADFADDLQRFLDGEPVNARPLSWLRRMHRWARHRPGVAVTVCMTVAFLVFHTTVSVLGLQQNDPRYNLTATVVGGLAILNAVCWQRRLQDSEGAEWTLYGWSTGEILLLTSLIALGKGLSSMLVPAWSVLIAVSGLRRRPALVVFVTLASLLSYGGLWVVQRFLHGASVDSLQVCSNMLIFLLVGLIQFIIIRQSSVSLELGTLKTRHSTAGQKDSTAPHSGQN